jgi:hypothetical protein
MLRGLAFSLLLVACATDQAPKTPERAAPPAPSAKSSAAPAVEPPAEYLAVVDTALEQVAEARALPAKERVKGAIIGREELLERMKGEIFSQLEPELLEGSTEMLFALNTTRADFDYVKSLLALLGSQLAGFYDPREKKMYLLNDLGTSGEAATLFHELVHALQDQHYVLEPRMKWRPGRGDEVTALQALAEGDATSAMIDNMLAPQGQTALDINESLITAGFGLMEAAPALSEVPAILTRSLAAPYTDGLRFVHHLRRNGGWQAVDAAWTKTPTTTEQILHPEKYLAGEGSVTLPLPPAPPDGPATVRYEDVFGEQGLRLVFEEWVPLSTAAESATGWAGDRVAVFVAGEQRAVAIHVRFDDEVSAKRALAAVARGAASPELESTPDRGVATRVPPEVGERAVKSGRVCHERPLRGPFATVRKGRDLAVVLGPYRRGPGAPRSAGTCEQALRWAASVTDSR